MAFFKAICADHLLNESDIPPSELPAARELAGHYRSERYFQMLERCWRLVLGLCAGWERSALPMDVGTAIAIAIRMGECRYSLGYTRNVRSAIAFAHRYSCLPDPTQDQRYLAYFDCIARRLGDAHLHAKAALFVDQLRRIGEELAPRNDLRSIQEWAILALGYFTTFRRVKSSNHMCVSSEMVYTSNCGGARTINTGAAMPSTSIRGRTKCALGPPVPFSQGKV